MPPLVICPFRIAHNGSSCICEQCCMMWVDNDCVIKTAFIVISTMKKNDPSYLSFISQIRPIDSNTDELEIM